MRFLLCVVSLLVVASTILVDPEGAKQLFDEIIEEDGLDLDDIDYQDRLQKFQINLMASDDTTPINADLMFTAAELARMNGARMINGLKSAYTEELKKRGDDEYKRGVPPIMYDGRTAIKINPVQHQLACGNCYIHTFIAALEIAYVKATGKLVKFSEQELTDCYARGCEGGDYRMVAVTMSYLDKLSLRSIYGKYLNGQGTCRMGSTPDALQALKVVDYRDVPVERAPEAIMKYGSVMTCMKWDGRGGVCDMNGYDGGVVDKPAVPGGCDHAVLIVGFTPTYWIVRNSHGTDWGDGGYFKIVRGKNACGIEEGMAALVTKTRLVKDGLEENGCPTSKPYYCPNLNSCTSHECLGLEEEEEVVERDEEEEDNEREEEIVEERDGDEMNLDMDDEDVELENREIRVPGEEREKRDIPGKLQRLLVKRGVSEEDIAEYYAKRSDESEEEILDKRGSCVDQAGDICAEGLKINGKAKLCGSIAGTQQCALTCGTCSNTNTKVQRPSREPRSDCFVPRIRNGRTVPRNGTVKHGAPLVIQCRPGSVLAGNDNPRCLVQEVFTNDDKDGRLLPECVRLGSDTLYGSGTRYRGSKNFYIHDGTKYECDSWNKDILRGVLPARTDGLKMAIGTHNYCRNPNGMEPVPFCIGSASGVGTIHYCFKGPGCDTCRSAVDAAGSWCDNPKVQASCSYTVVNTRNRVKDVQQRCARTCCRVNGCATV